MLNHYEARWCWVIPVLPLPSSSATFSLIFFVYITSMRYGCDGRLKKYNFSKNLHENMASMAAGTSAVNQQFAILEMRRKLAQVKTSGNVIGDALVSYWPFSPVPINSPRCPRSSPRSKRLRRKERPRNGIFGFGRTRNETRAKK